MKLKPIGLFHTPESMDEMMAYIEKFSGSERTAAMTAAMMMWNLCAKLTSDCCSDNEPNTVECE
jgi:hypothetical protein